MKNSTYIKIYRKMIYIFPVLGLLIAAAYMMSYKSGYNEAIGHFDGTIWFGFYVGVCLSTAAFCGILALGTKKRFAVVRIPRHTITEITASVCGVLASSAAFVSFLAGFKNGTESVLGIVYGFFILFIILSFILNLIDSMRGTMFRLFCSFGEVLAVNLLIFREYFDLSVPINSPVRYSTVVLTCAALLFIVSEARISLGPEDSPYNRNTAVFYIFSSAACASLTFGISLGALLVYIFVPFADNPNLPPLTLAYFIAFSVLAFSRLVAFPKVCGKYTLPAA